MSVRFTNRMFCLVACAFSVCCHATRTTSLHRGEVAGGGTDNAVSNGGSSESGDGGSGGSAPPLVGTTPNTLYHLGLGAQSTVYSVAVDDENIYWAGASLIQAPKGGGGQRVIIGNSSTGIFVIRPAKDWVYWIQDGELARSQKHRKDLAGATFQPIDLGGIQVLDRTNPVSERLPLDTGRLEALLMEGETVYAATAGCRAVTRFEPTSSAQTTIRASATVADSVGFTYLLKYGEDVYCAAYQRVFRLRGFAQMEEVTSSAIRIAGIAVSSNRLYWLDKLSNSSTDSSGQVWTMSEQGSPSKVGEVLTSAGATTLYADEPRNRLVWVDTALADFSLRDNVFHVWKHSNLTSGGSARDDDYLYWTVASTSFGTIERLRFDEP